MDNQEGEIGIRGDLNLDGIILWQLNDCRQALSKVSLIGIDVVRDTINTLEDLLMPYANREYMDYREALHKEITPQKLGEMISTDKQEKLHDYEIGELVQGEKLRTTLIRERLRFKALQRLIKDLGIGLVREIEEELKDV